MMSYTTQLHDKIQRIIQQFSALMPNGCLVPQVFASPEMHFRMRAEFRIWHHQDDLFYAMFERDQAHNKQVVRIDQFEIAHQSISGLMQPLLQAIKQQPVLSERLFEIDFLASLYGEVLVSLIYHRALDDKWHHAAQALAEQFKIKLIGRSRKQKIILSEDFITERFQVKERVFEYRQIENGFSQPNAFICQHMLNWACDMASQYGNSDSDLLELYCGNGNFTLPLSYHFRRVIATEIAKSSVKAAQWALETNGIGNVQLIRLSAEEIGQALSGERKFRRLQDQEVNLLDYKIETVFVDPPRSGIDAATLQLLSKFSSILYISCNPDTLYDNLLQLTQTHEIQQFALFDQFPFTHHIECGVMLTRKSD